MKLSKFQDEYHWMNGLSEYFQFTGQDDKWDNIHKALWHDNWYRKRDVMIELCQMSNSSPTHIRAWMNILLHEKLDDVEIKPQLIATLFRKYMEEDPFLVNICQFVNYWAQGDAAADMPNMNDFLSRGQVKSKVWMISQLAQLIDGPMGNVVFYGGWYNFLGHMLFSQFDVKRIYSLDIDEKVILPSKRLYPKEVKQGRFLPLKVDCDKIRWDTTNAQTMLQLDQAKKMNLVDDFIKEKGEDFCKQNGINVWDLADEENWGYKRLDEMQVVINTSCEHMTNEWFENLPAGTFVSLQTNDYFDNPQHSNCCKDLEAAKEKYPMQSIMYQGELDTHLYNRFMLIGIK